MDGKLVLNNSLIGQFAEKRVFETPPAKDNQKDTVESLDFHNSEPILVSVTTNGHAIRLYNVEKGTLERSLLSPKYGASSARFTHHPLTILYASNNYESAHELENHAIRYHSLHDNAYLRYFKGHTAEVLDIDVSHVSDTFFSASRDRTIRRWDLRTEGSQGQITVTRDTVKPRIAYDREDVIIAVGLDGGFINLHDARNISKPFETIKGEYTRLERPSISCIKMSKLSGSKYVAVTINGKIHAYDIRKGTAPALLHSFEVPYHSVQEKEERKLEFDFTPDDKYLVSGYDKGGVAVWSLEGETAGQQVARLVGEQTGFPNCLKWSARHALFATGSDNVVFWAPDFEQKVS